MEDLVIFGAGGMAREAKLVIDDINTALDKPVWNFLGFIDAEKEKTFKPTKKTAVLVSIGSPKIIQKVVQKLKKLENVWFPNISHPIVLFQDMPTITMGEGNFFAAGTILTTNIKIGSFNIFNRGLQIGHDSEIGSFNVINPSAVISGNVYIGNTNLIGTNSTIIENKEIGDLTTIGAGAVVIRNIPDGVTAVGVPAEPLNNPYSAE